MSDQIEQSRICADSDCRARLIVTATKTPMQTTNKFWCPVCGDENYVSGAGYYTNINVRKA